MPKQILVYIYLRFWVLVARYMWKHHSNNNNGNILEKKEPNTRRAAAEENGERERERCGKKSVQARSQRAIHSCIILYFYLIPPSAIVYENKNESKKSTKKNGNTHPL